MQTIWDFGNKKSSLCKASKILYLHSNKR